MTRQTLGKARAGAMAGIVGGMALSSSFMAIDSNIGVPPGTFYNMIGTLIGLQNMDAIVFGFMVHMGTAALIGAVFFMCSTLHSVLNITSFQKGVFAGGVTGLVVYGIFFLPLNLFIMMPQVEEVLLNAEQFGLSEKVTENIRILISNTEQILWGSFYLHLLFGVVMGFFAGAMLPENYKVSKGKQRTD